MNDFARIRTRAERNRRGEYRAYEHVRRGLCLVQGDQAVANQAGASFRSDLNNELQALVTLSSGTAAPGTTYAHELWADTTSNLLKKRNAANSSWIVVRTLDELFVLSRASNTILAGSDVGKTMVATAAFTQTLTAAATLADGWWVCLRNASSGALTIDPNSTETVDGATTRDLSPGESCVLVCNGSAFFTIGLDNVNALDADGTPDTANDYVKSWDASAGRHKKVLLNLVGMGAASQAQMEAASSNVVAVTPGRQQFHPSAIKAWVHTDTASGIQASYNVSSITDIGAGQAGVNYSTAFSSARGYTCFGCAESNALMFVANNAGTISTTRRDFVTYTAGGSASDPSYWHMGFAGDQ